jgi:hypothetical protein
LKRLKFSVLFVEDGLFRIEHQTVYWTHEVTSRAEGHRKGDEPYQSGFGWRKPIVRTLSSTFGADRLSARLG